MNDNRKYEFGRESISSRPEYPIIIKMIEKGSTIIDLGCGDGSLLYDLKNSNEAKQCIGLEISDSGIKSCKEKGIKAIKMKIDSKLPFDDNEFDYAICNVTIQMVMYPEILIGEMIRISKKQIISFPNFAFIMNRLELLLKGRMPKFMIPGYDWFSTGHIHQLSLNDFYHFCNDNHISIIQTNNIYPDKFLCIPRFIFKKLPNLFATIGIYKLKK